MACFHCSLPPWVNKWVAVVVVDRLGKPVCQSRLRWCSGPGWRNTHWHPCRVDHTFCMAGCTCNCQTNQKEIDTFDTKLLLNNKLSTSSWQHFTFRGRVQSQGRHSPKPFLLRDHACHTSSLHSNYSCDCIGHRYARIYPQAAMWL